MAMAKDNAEVEYYLEILFANKLELDEFYHDPNLFLIKCNNTICSIEAFLERGRKQKGKNDWYHNGVNEYCKSYNEEYQIIKALRNRTLHFKMIIPDCAISFGLYRISNRCDYIQKIGMGNDKKITPLPQSLLSKETGTIFHHLLQMHYIVFIDIEHSAKYECLGITRRWFYEVEYKKDGIQKKIIVDIYKFICTSMERIYNAVCSEYGKICGKQYSQLPFYYPSEYNYINTLLEIDLYPNMMKKWWNLPDEPLNWKYLLEYRKAQSINDRISGIEKVFSKMPHSKKEYMDLIDRYITVKFEDFTDQDDYNSFMYFICFQHWYIKVFSTMKLLSTKIDFIYKLHSLAENYLENIDCRVESLTNIEINNELIKMQNVLKEIRNVVVNID